MVDYLVPLILLGVSLAALWKRENSYELLLSGAAEGLRLLSKEIEYSAENTDRFASAE